MIAAVAVLFVLVSCNSAVLLNMLRKMQRLRREGVEQFTRASLPDPRRITPLPSVVPTISGRSLPLFPLPQPPATAPSPSPPSAAATTARSVPIVAGSAGDLHVANASATAPVAPLPAVQPRPSADTGDPRPTPPQAARNEGDEDVGPGHGSLTPLPVRRGNTFSDLLPSSSLSYRCTECNRLFKSKTTLRIHTYTRHGGGK